MIKCRDTFLHFLSDNLSGGITVHNIRRDADDPERSNFKENAVNVLFLDVIPSVLTTKQLVAVDVIHTDERTAATWLGTVWSLLKSAFYTPLLDYSNPSAPVAVGSHIMWNGKDITFRRVLSDPSVVRYSAVFPLEFRTD